MFNKVVWATDGSKSADRALGVARTLVEESHGELFAVHVEELALWGNQAVPAHGHGDEYREKIEGQVGELSNGGVTATLTETRSGVGGAAHAIADAAKTLEADVIVTGTRGHTQLAGLLLGSVTERLLHVAPCPVLAVPPGAEGSG